MNDKTLYPAYAGLGRTAMFIGVPLMAALVVFAISVFASLVGAAVLGPGGLLLAVPGIGVFMFLKDICATDDQALRILWLEVRCFLDRVNARCFGNTYTLAPIRYGRRLDTARRSFAIETDKTFDSAFVKQFYERAATRSAPSEDSDADAETGLATIR